MPLRDHFHPPLEERHRWDAVHGQWPAMIVLQMFPLLPEGFSASPRIHLGSSFEIDIATFEANGAGEQQPPFAGSGTRTAALLAAPKPSLTVETELFAQDVYEVRVYDARRGQRLVAAIELVSPANKDRRDHRAAFVAKCLALLQQQVCVTIVDLVTNRDFNLFAELLAQMGKADPMLDQPPPPIYAVTCRARAADKVTLLDAWTFALEIGQPLPRIPIWLSEELMVYLDLEAGYEETCRVLHIP